MPRPSLQQRCSTLTRHYNPAGNASPLLAAFRPPPQGFDGHGVWCLQLQTACVDVWRYLVRCYDQSLLRCASSDCARQIFPPRYHPRNNFLQTLLHWPGPPQCNSCAACCCSMLWLCLQLCQQNHESDTASVEQPGWHPNEHTPEHAVGISLTQANSNDHVAKHLS